MSSPNTSPVTGSEMIRANQGENPVWLSLDDVARYLGKPAGLPAIAGVNGLNPNQFGIVSDSRGHNFNILGGGGTTQVLRKSAQNAMTWMLALMGQRMRCVYNGGNSGKRSDQWQLLQTVDPRFPGLNNIDAFFTTNAQWLFFAGIGVNDIAQLVTADQIWFGYGGAPGLKALFARVIASGRRPVLFAETGAGNTGYTAAMVAETNRLNRYLEEFALTNPQAVYADLTRVVWDGTSTNTSQIVQKANYYPAPTDTTHLKAFGSYFVGAYLAGLMSPLVPPVDRLIKNVTQNPTNGAVQLVQTPLFSPLGSQPANANGITYTSGVPANMQFNRALASVSASGAATANIGIAADPNGYGNAMTIAATFTADTESIWFLHTCSVAGLTPGDKIYANAQVDITASSGARNPSINMRLTADGTQYPSTDLENNPLLGSTFGAMPDVTPTLTLETEIVTVPPNGTLSLFVQGIMAAGPSGGSQTARWSRIGVHKVLS